MRDLIDACHLYRWKVILVMYMRFLLFCIVYVLIVFVFIFFSLLVFEVIQGKQFSRYGIS